MSTMIGVIVSIKRTRMVLKHGGSLMMTGEKLVTETLKELLKNG